MLRQAGYIAMSGQIVDASLVAAPRQRNTDDEKKAIKEGRIPPNWKAKPAKLRHKDRDARWTVKFSKAKPREDGSTPPVDLAIPLFGYQNHVSIDRRFGFIRRWAATDAAAYARQEQYSERGVGRYRLSIGGQRDVPEQEWLRQPHPSQEAERPRYARDDAASGIPRLRDTPAPAAGSVTFPARSAVAAPQRPYRAGVAGDATARKLNYLRAMANLCAYRQPC